MRRLHESEGELHQFLKDEVTGLLESLDLTREEEALKSNPDPGSHSCHFGSDTAKVKVIEVS